jgi:AraC family transcriptional regulator
MSHSTLYIKNMVCARCQKVVNSELVSLGLHPQSVRLGEVTLLEEETGLDKNAIRAALAKHGFQLLDEKKARMIEKIKSTVIEQIHYQNPGHPQFSRLIEEGVGLDYTYLSALFSATENTTIEKYIILQRVERVKELLVYDELSLNQIADQLGYSSVQHLSNQFKKITGYTPSYYKKRKENKRLPLDEL